MRHYGEDLETGAGRPESMAPYERAGYRRIARFGPYVDCEVSICFERPPLAEGEPGPLEDLRLVDGS
ncbi:hypothetical protein [Halostreptopolyspora alba]|uniref:hypothetical protein n=1 Tax=Halostreptopolyspora alba TaxID=2487137 RepID=UPI0026C6DFDB